MQRSVFFIVSLLSVHFTSHASDFVKTPVGNGLELDVPIQSVLDAERVFTQLSSNMSACKDTSTEYIDPIIDRKNTIVINKNSRGICQITWIKDALWQYQCQAPSLDRKKWQEIFSERLENKRFFGDFSEVEQSILFDEKTCLVTRQN